MDIIAEFNALKKKVADLEGELADIRGAPEAILAPAPVPPPPREPQVTVSYPVEASSFILPSDDELDRLATVVHARYPKYGDVSGPGFYGSKEAREEDFWRQYKAVFLALGSFRRLPEPDRKKALSYHVSAVEAHLRAMGKSKTLRGQPFMTAVLAHGDIPYAGLEKTIELGLAEHVGRSAGDAWRGVLKSGQLLAPSAVIVPRYWSMHDLSNYAR